MEVVPIYQTALLIMWIGTGLVILDEKQFYSYLELTLIFGSVLVCFVGIKVLTQKKKLLEAEEAIKSSSEVSAKASLLQAAVNENDDEYKTASQT